MHAELQQWRLDFNIQGGFCSRLIYCNSSRDEPVKTSSLQVAEQRIQIFIGRREHYKIRAVKRLAASKHHPLKNQVGQGAGRKARRRQSFPSRDSHVMVGAEPHPSGRGSLILPYLQPRKFPLEVISSLLTVRHLVVIFFTLPSLHSSVPCIPLCSMFLVWNHSPGTEG